MGRRIRPLAVIAISTAVGIVSIGSRGVEPPGWDRVANRAEAFHIQERLARVEAELAGRDVSVWSAVQRTNRAHNMVALHRYWSAGRFPHNHDFPNRSVPYFQDRHGSPSALAYLMAQSGRQDLVDRITTIDNNGTVFELVDNRKLGPALQSWLGEAGLTIEEAGLMQSAYGDP